MSVVLSLLASLTWGVSDFLGGTAAKRLSATAVVAVSQALALVGLLVVAGAMRAFDAPLGYLGWALGAAVFSVIALSAFYAALASGTMGVVAPIAALGVAVPVVVGLALGDRPTVAQDVGVVVAVIGVVLASGPEARAGAGRRPLLLAAVAAVGFGVVILFVARGAKTDPTMTLVVMIMPAAALVLPIFLELNAMHLIGRSLSVILPFAFFPFGVYLAYIYYLTALPRDLLDAARVDGASELQTFLRVALPLAKPIVALVFFFSFVADWNNFFLPYVVLSNPHQLPITVGLWDLLASTPAFNPSVGGGGGATNIFKPELAIATVIAVLPIAVIFVASQRALVRGLVGGGVKG